MYLPHVVGAFIIDIRGEYAVEVRPYNRRHLCEIYDHCKSLLNFCNCWRGRVCGMEKLLGKAAAKHWDLINNQSRMPPNQLQHQRLAFEYDEAPNCCPGDGAVTSSCSHFIGLRKLFEHSDVDGRKSWYPT